jgi:hypothetical protein
MPTHLLRKPVAARHAHRKRRNALKAGIAVLAGLAGLLTFLLFGCGGGGGTTNVTPAVVSTPASATLTASDVENIVHAAAAATAP